MDALRLKRSQSLKKVQGFTLVEVLAVLIIVAILAGIGTPIYIGYVKGARSADAQTTMSALITANKIYFQKFDHYTSRIEDLEEKHLIQIDEGTRTMWKFDMQAHGKDFTSIKATSTDKMPGGAGKNVTFVLNTGKFTGYGTDDENDQ